MIAFAELGGVWLGSLEPKIATCGTCSAAAMCMRPESLLTTLLHIPIMAMASSSDVLPHQLKIRPSEAVEETMASPMARSDGLPNKTTEAVGFAFRIDCASAAKCAAGQRLLGPYSAPGQSTTSASV